jgi:hypothetical protein
MLFDMPPIWMPEAPAIIRAAEPWERQIHSDLVRRGVPRIIRQAVVKEVKRLADARPTVIRPALNDLACYAGIEATFPFPSVLMNRYEAIVGSHITAGIDTDGNATAVSASITPAANVLHLLRIQNLRDGVNNPGTPTCAGCSMTWTRYASADITGSLTRLTVFYGLGVSPTTGSVTVTYPNNASLLMFSIDAFTGTRIDGTAGSGAMVQGVTKLQTGTTTGVTVTLAAFLNGANATYGTVGMINVSDRPTITVGSGFTGLWHDATNRTQEVEWKATNDTSVDWTWPSGNHPCLAAAIELAAA